MVVSLPLLKQRVSAPEVPFSLPLHVALDHGEHTTRY